MCIPCTATWPFLSNLGLPIPRVAIEAALKGLLLGHTLLQNRFRTASKECVPSQVGAVRNCMSEIYEQRQLVEQFDWKKREPRKAGNWTAKGQHNFVSLDVAWCRRTSR